jgi:hypothetical protein
MKNKLTTFLSTFMIVMVGFSSLPIVNVMSAQPTYAQTTCGQAANNSFFGFPVWYRGLNPNEGDCTVQLTKLNDIWIIVLNIIDILLRAVAYIAAGFIIYGGFKYLTSAGSPDGAVAARKTIINAIIGLVISFASVAIVNLVSGAIH